MLTYDELYLTDGTTTVDLLSLATPTGAHLRTYRPSASRQKGGEWGGTWHDSVLASGQRPAFYAWDAVEARMGLDLVGWTENDVSDLAAKIRNLLQAARDYFVGALPNVSPVYLIRRARGQATHEYSLVLAGTAPEDAGYAATSEHYGTVGYENWECSIVREEHWRDTVPMEEGACVYNAGYQSVCRPCFVEFAADGIITSGNGGALDDLHDDAMTAEAWVRIDVGTTCQVINKGLAVAGGWDLSVTLPAGAIWATVNCAVAAGIRWTVNGTLTADGLWHHVAFTWDDAADLRPRIWVDGVEATYGGGQDRNGAIVTDAGQNLLIGNNAALTMDLLGAVGWTRVSEAVLYATTFTPDPRCDLPWVAAPTVAQWVGAECAGATIHEQGLTVAWDGTLGNGAFDCDCYDWVGNVDPADDSVDYSCDEDDIEVFVRGSHGRAAITQIWIGAGGGGAPFTGNWVEASAYPLLPAVVQVGDEVWFGIDNTAMFYGPFANLVFDLVDNAVDLAGDWFYWTGAWTNLNVGFHDGTDDLNAVGTCAISWVLPANNWVSAAPAGGPGITGYWVRFVVSGITANNPPTQQNRPVYTTTWGYTEFEDTSVPGDVPALAHIVIPLAGEPETPSTVSDMEPSRVILASRSLSRGADFVPYFNFGDPSAPGVLGAQAPIGVSAGTMAVGAQVTDTTRQQGVHVLGTNTVPDTWENVQGWSIDSAYAIQYYGQYRVYLRARAMAVAGTVEVRLQLYSSVEMLTTTDAYTILDTNQNKLIDLGTVSIPAQASIRSTESLYLGAYFYVQQRTSNVADTVQYYDMFLCPVDEKVVEVVTAPAGTGTMHWLDKSRLLIDSTTTLRTGGIRALVGVYAASTFYISLGWMSVTGGPAWFQANADQRLWMMTERYSGAYWYSTNQTHMAVLLKRIARYQSLRGSR